MIILVISALTLYCCWLMIMIIGWQLIRLYPKSSTFQPRVSVIIPFRNEAENLDDLIKSLRALNYPNHLLEVFLINDHSEDNYDININKLTGSIKTLHLPEEKTGKKAAITYGVENSSGEIIITSDADCLFNSEWIDVLIKPFTESNTQLVFGAVKFHANKTFFHRLQSVEFMPVIGTGAASAQFGQPFMCNGANLSFRRHVFEEVNGYEGNEQIASGDDEFLMYKIRKKYPSGIVFNKHPKSVVSTKPSVSVQYLVNQRRRWASKWSYNISWYKIAVVLLVTFNVLGTLLSFIFLIENSLPQLWIFLALKVVLEGLLILMVGRSLESRFDITAFISMQFIYPFYGLFIAVSSNIGQYKWKGRTH